MEITTDDYKSVNSSKYILTCIKRVLRTKKAKSHNQFTVGTTNRLQDKD